MGNDSAVRFPIALTVVDGSPGEIRIRVGFVLPSAGLSSVRGSRAVY